MALTSEIIAWAFREANYRSIVDAPSTEEQAEALTLLRGLCATFVPMVVGVHLPTVPVASNATLSGAARLMVSAGSPTTVVLPTQPQSGMVVEYVDAGHTVDVTLDAGDRFFGDRQPTQQVLLGASFPTARNRTRQWLYRDDIASWDELTDLQASAPFPFPPEFNDWFVMMLAIRLSPRFGSDPRAMTMQRAKEMEDFVRLHWRRSFPAAPVEHGIRNAEQSFTREF